MRKTIAVLAVLFLAAAAFAQAPADRNANGVGYYVLQVPNPASMAIDGSDADWAWFDPTYVITMDQFKSEQDAPMPDPADMEITAKLAWSAAPENMWYTFVKVHDDTLDIESTDITNPWSDDCINFGWNVLDGPRDEARAFYYAWVIKAPTFLTEPNAIYAVRPDQPPGYGELGRAPYAYAAVASDPPEAIQMPIWTSDTGGDMFYEFKTAVWDMRSPDGAAGSIRTSLEAGKFIPFLLNVEDGDGPWYFDATIRSAAATAAAYFAGTTLLGVGDYSSPTAVESSTWGRIKGSFGQ
ncbi:MAG: hypothetical protein AB1505_31320 [Candidatus Latescibacterota bacterium]